MIKCVAHSIKSYGLLLSKEIDAYIYIYTNKKAYIRYGYPCVDMYQISIDLLNLMNGYRKQIFKSIIIKAIIMVMMFCHPLSILAESIH